MQTIANADQSEFWNTEAGPRWVAREADLDALHSAVTGMLLAECAPVSGEAILDVGCGGGASSLAFAEAVGASGRVLGLDLSRPLLARAEARCRAAGLGNLGFLFGDAQVHPLPSAAFDAAISRFGVMFFSDPIAAFRNIATALRPGGRLVFVAWAGLDRNPFFSLPLRAAMARLGPLAPPPPDAPGPMAFADRDRVVGLLQAARLADCAADARRIDLHHPGGVAAITALATEIGPTARFVREKNGTADDLAAIIADLADSLAAFATPDGIRIPAEINLFRATMP